MNDYVLMRCPGFIVAREDRVKVDHALVVGGLHAAEVARGQTALALGADTTVLAGARLITYVSNCLTFVHMSNFDTEQMLTHQVMEKFMSGLYSTFRCR